MIVGFNYTFRFGKHVGKTVQRVLKQNPQYIRWAMSTLNWFEPSEHVLVTLDRIETINRIEKVKNSNRVEYSIH